MKISFNNKFKGKRVLITGHTGFKGSWITLWLKELGSEILGYSLPPNTTPSLFNVLDLEKQINNVFGDICDEEKLKQTFKDFQPEIVLHLAAQPLVRLSYREPRYTYETNIMGTINLLEAVRNTPSAKVVVNVTSDKCYENREWVFGYRENDPMGGYDPYSSSKGISELVTSSYRNSFFNPQCYGDTHTVALSSARAGNVIGGGDWSEDRLIPDCAKAISKGETIYIRSPHSIRPWQHVLEPLSGYLCLASLMIDNGQKYSEGWNFGPNNDDILTVDEVVKKLIHYWESGSYVVQCDNPVHEAKLLKLDISKAHFYLNWKPVYKADQAIQETVEWYKAYYSRNQDMQAFTKQQIFKYVQAAQHTNIQWSQQQKRILC